MTNALALAGRLADEFAQSPEVEAVVVAGSRTNQVADEMSDIDVCVYARGEVPVTRRAAIAAGARHLELDNRFFETGDEWIDGETGIRIDVMFRDPAWIEGQIDRVLVGHQASIGYSTAFWHNVLRSVSLFDRNGWFAALAARAAVPYPEELRRAIVAKNQPLLAANQSSYCRQIELGVMRGDTVSVNHRAAAFLASYFDVLFAVNRLPHPGEKRLLAIAERACARRPPRLSDDVRDLIAAIPGGDAAPRAVALAAGLDDLLRDEGLL